MADPRPILFFDSGVGGISVLRAAREMLPERRFVYAADDAAFPYGDWEEGALTEHVVEVIGSLIGRFDPAAVVIACNTASTLVLPPLRLRFSLPFVGTVPAIKPAAEQTRSGVIAVLSTPGTMKRVYTRDLISSFAKDCHVRLVGALELARLAEERMRGGPIDRGGIAAQIADCFVEIDGRRTDVVVLACTHYPFLADVMAELAPWPVTWIDPAPAIARRLIAVLPEGNGGERSVPGRSEALFTSGNPPPASLAKMLASHGLAPAEAVGQGGRDRWI